jgi:integrase/recombinase XerD
VKNANDLEFPLMSESVELLNIYLDEWRPLLTTESSRFLFPARCPTGTRETVPSAARSKRLFIAIRASICRRTGSDTRPPRFISIATPANTRWFGNSSDTSASRQRLRSTAALRVRRRGTIRRRSWGFAAATSGRRPPCLISPTPGPQSRAGTGPALLDHSASTRGRLLEDDGLAASWAPNTSALIAGGYGRYLSFLAETDDLDSLACPEDRITRSRVEAYIAYLRARNQSNTVAGRILQLVRAAAVMAPSVDWAWLRRIAGRLRRIATPAHDDRARLLPAATLFDLATRLIHRSGTEIGLSARLRALLFRDGLMIAVLCAWAPRARNVAATTIGVSLQRRGDTWWAAFGPGETKNRRPIEIPLPDTFTAWIERYLADHRPQLISRSAIPVAGDAFWISDRGKPLTAKGVGRCISAVTQRELGRAVNPHLFRKIIPTELAIRDPAHVGIAQPILGHATYDTTQKAYNLGRAIDAARRHNALIEALRAGGAGAYALAPVGITGQGVVRRPSALIRTSRRSA